jgi:large subunit ribosomal protein L25
MTKHYALSAAKRERAGKGVARALRRENKIPGVIYGDNKEAVAIELPVKEITLEYHKGHMFTNLCDLTVDGAKQLVLVRDLQIHPVTDNVLHVDFLRVSPKTTLKVHVPVHFTGHEESPGMKRKGVLNVVRHDVEIICLATDIPEQIEVDLTPFNIGDAIKISAVKLPKGAKPAIEGRDFTIATIAQPRAVIEEEAAPAAEGEAAAAEAPKAE